MISEELKSQLQEAQFLLSRFKEWCSENNVELNLEDPVAIK